MNKKYALNSFQMKEIDTFTIEQIGIPSCVLMEKAAMAVVHHVKKVCSKENKIIAVCGYGNCHVYDCVWMQQSCEGDSYKEKISIFDSK